MKQQQKCITIKNWVEPESKVRPLRMRETPKSETRRRSNRAAIRGRRNSCWWWYKSWAREFYFIFTDETSRKANECRRFLRYDRNLRSWRTCWKNWEAREEDVRFTLAALGVRPSIWEFAGRSADSVYIIINAIENVRTFSYLHKCHPQTFFYAIASLNFGFIYSY